MLPVCALRITLECVCYSAAGYASKKSVPSLAAGLVCGVLFGTAGYASDSEPRHLWFARFRVLRRCDVGSQIHDLSGRFFDRQRICAECWYITHPPLILFRSPPHSLPHLCLCVDKPLRVPLRLRWCRATRSRRRFAPTSRGASFAPDCLALCCACRSCRPAF
jgi:hypothetical protein